MKSTPQIRTLQSHLAAASRDHGRDSTEARTARRNWNAARIVHLAAESVAVHGAFTDAQVIEILAALQGKAATK